MEQWSLFLPPLAFALVFLAVCGVVFGMGRCSGVARGKLGKGMQSYACGEKSPSHMVQPKYSQFFPFAFFFTILHVVALMSATVPGGSFPALIIAGVYVLGAIVGLFVLYTR
ncbi:MAG: hypothetical protein WC869_01495 [Phycisphaerae bacterium]|jgi:NADH-quinone oxidoreductase subunit A